jgi:hypothetical protein
MVEGGSSTWLFCGVGRNRRFFPLMDRFCPRLGGEDPLIDEALGGASAGSIGRESRSLAERWIPRRFLEIRR